MSNNQDIEISKKSEDGGQSKQKSQKDSFSLTFSLQGLITIGTIILSVLGSIWYMSSQFTEVKTNVANLTNEINYIRPKVDTLSTDLSSANTNVKSLTDGMNYIRPLVGTLSTDLSSANTNVKSLTDGMNYIRPLVDTLSKDLSSANTNIKAIQNDISSNIKQPILTLNTRLDGLEKEFIRIANKVDNITQSLERVDVNIEKTVRQEFRTINKQLEAIKKPSALIEKNQFRPASLSEQSLKTDKSEISGTSAQETLKNIDEIIKDFQSKPHDQDIARPKIEKPTQQYE